MTILLWHTIYYIHTSFIHKYIHTYSVHSIFIKNTYIHFPALYGFGAAADVTLYLPLLRNMMAWLTAGGASYKTLKAGISQASQAQTYTFFLYVCLYVCMYVCMYVRICSSFLYRHIHACVHNFIQRCIHTYILEYIHSDTYT